VGSALWGVVFCLDFGPFLFLPLFPCWVSFPLFIYLFIIFLGSICMPIFGLDLAIGSIRVSFH
jgi:hypothetical protein